MPIFNKIPQTLEEWLGLSPIQTGLHLLVILLFAWAGTIIARRLVAALRRHSIRIMQRHGDPLGAELEKRANTIASVVGNTAIGTIWTIALVMCLAAFSIHVEALVAGAGVIGVALGFGAQNLVRDVIGGLFLLVENQIRVNDVAQINGVGGLVEEINLRTTVLRSENGAVHIFPNGSITSLANLTRGFSYYVFEIGVAYKEDTDHVLALMKEVAEQIGAEEPYRTLILAPLDVMGVDRFAESAVIVKARIKTLPSQQWTVGREMNRQLKKKFEETGIVLPFPTRTLNFADEIPHLDREELKQAIREVMGEKA